MPTLDLNSNEFTGMLINSFVLFLKWSIDHLEFTVLLYVVGLCSFLSIVF